MTRIISLYESLTWLSDTGAEASTETAQRYLEWVASALGALLDRENTEQSSVLKQCLQLLPGDRMIRVLKAPSTCHHLIRGDSQLTGAAAANLAEGITAELALANFAPEVEASSLWTALGDVQLSRGSCGTWQPVYTAQRIGPGLLVDVRGPHALRKAGIDTGARLPYSPAQEGRIVAKLAETWDVLAQIAPRAAAFVADHTVVLCARPDDAEPLHFTSASSRATIGKLVLVNAHLVAVDIPVLLNALIHEAIHSFLYKHELECPFALDIQVGLTVSAVSPWTGSRLSVTTYIHACYVYFGLLAFWHLDSARARLGAEVVDAQLSFLGRGFRGNRATLDALPPDTLRPAVIEAVYHLQDLAERTLSDASHA